MAEMACELDNSKGTIDFENIKFFLKQKLTTIGKKHIDDHDFKIITKLIFFYDFFSSRHN
jgi:hypothetical protein